MTGTAFAASDLCYSREDDPHTPAGLFARDQVLVQQSDMYRSSLHTECRGFLLLEEPDRELCLR